MGVNMFSVSIIIPVYNSAPYIIKCLDSVHAQTQKNLEVIFVDDHGTDNTMDIIRDFLISKKREDITCIFLETKRNSGPSIARNIGIAKARGEYIAFLDADDWLSPTMCETLYANAKREDAELSCGQAILDFEDGRPSKLMCNPFVGNGALSDGKKRYILNRYISNFTTFLFRRTWLLEKDLSFPPTRSGEDSCFMGCCYLSAKRIAQVDAVVYHYVIHSDSLSHKKRTWRGKEKRQSFKALIQYAKKNNMLKEFRFPLYFIYIKKAWLTPIKEWFS